MAKLLVRNYLVFTSILLFVFSLTQTAFITIDESQKSGLSVFLLGPLGVLFELGAFFDFLMNLFHGRFNLSKIPSFISFVWLANPILFFSWIMIKKNPKIVLILSLISMLLIVSFAVYGKVPTDEAVHYKCIKQLKFGYWCWFLSAFLMVLISFYKFVQSKKNSDEFR